jgi:hypothetical protein
VPAFRRDAVDDAGCESLFGGEEAAIAGLAGTHDAIAGGLVASRLARLEHHLAGCNREGCELARVSVLGFVVFEVAYDHDFLLLLLKPRYGASIATGYGPRLWRRRGVTAEGDLPAWQAAFGRKSGIPPARSLDGGLGRTPKAPEWAVGSPPIEAPDPAAAKGRA